MAKAIENNEVHLKDFMKHCDLLTDVFYQNETAMGKLNNILNVKISLWGGIQADSRSGLLVEIINKTTGKIDALVFEFSDIIGRCELANNNGKYHLWRYRGEPFSWYNGEPTTAQKKKIMERLCKYIALFQ